MSHPNNQRLIQLAKLAHAANVLVISEYQGYLISFTDVCGTLDDLSVSAACVRGQLQGKLSVPDITRYRYINSERTYGEAVTDKQLASCESILRKALLASHKSIRRTLESPASAFTRPMSKRVRRWLQRKLKRTRRSLSRLQTIQERRLK